MLAGAGVGPHAGDRLLAAARAHGIEFDEMWGASDGPGEPYAAVVLLAKSAGRTRMVYTSPVRQPRERDAVAVALDRACGQIADATLAQALLEPGEDLTRAAFEAAGFTSVGELLYLRRSWADPGPVSPASPVEGVTVQPWRPGLEPELARALTRSYEGTLDCPELCGLREVDDVIESHKATGVFDPALWWLVRLDGAPAGALLLNPVPAQGHTELVYLGLAPALRGRGVAWWLLRRGLSHLADRSHRTVLCAVDTRNTPARALYERAGFTDFARRLAEVRPLRRAAPTPR
ncbi:MAG: GNAT family N-acetyltransferase [Planctomycetota bacterium]|nr:MAG: GNAT family N-acetyltransferase [Planctomycetota bacterium]